MQTAIIHFSRFRDSLTPDALPLPDEPPALFSVPLEADVVSVHPRRLEPGRYLVFEWHEGQQLGAPINVPSVENGRAYVPDGFVFEPSSPPEFEAVECWKAVRA